MAVPKLTFLLRTFPICKFPHLVSKFDNLIRQTLQSIVNANISDEKWILASLPARNGGVGIRRILDIGVPAFLSSIFNVCELVCTILPTLQADLSEISNFEETMTEWNNISHDAPLPPNPTSQRQWDAINIAQISKNLHFSSESDVARFKASLHRESGAWLTVLPSKNVGTLLDDNAFRISIALRLGLNICFPHLCICGAFVDESGIHGLSCLKIVGRNFRPLNLNDIIKRAFNSAEIPARLEPVGLCRDYGKRPDGITLVPWSNGQVLIWDATCNDMLAPSYIHNSARTSGSLANLSARHYRELIGQNYFFVPFAFETLGHWCEEALEIISSLGSRIAQITGESRSKLFLFQKISILI